MKYIPDEDGGDADMTSARTYSRGHLTAELFRRAEVVVKDLDEQASVVSNIRKPRSDNKPGRAAQVIEDLLKVILNDPGFKFESQPQTRTQPELWSREWWEVNGPIWRERLKAQNAGTAEKGHSKDAI